MVALPWLGEPRGMSQASPRTSLSFAPSCPLVDPQKALKNERGDRTTHAKWEELTPVRVDTRPLLQQLGPLGFVDAEKSPLTFVIFFLS